MIMPIIDDTDMASIAAEVRKRVRRLLSVYILLIVVSIVTFLLVSLLCLALYFDPELGDWNGICFPVFLISCSCVSLILKPLFRLFRRPKEKGKEIYRKDYPEFFAILDEVVSQVQCLKPKHVRISDECNAYAYYNNLFGYLLSGRQNLTIGLPLLYGMNITEMVAILSHEFGHFTQKTIATNSIANLSEFICASIVKAQEELEKKETDYYKKYSKWFARIVGDIMTHEYQKLAPYNRILSRAQEYDADHYSQIVVGTEGTISALCKLEHISKQWKDFFGIMISYQQNENRAPDDVLSVFSEYSTQMDQESGTYISSKIHLSELKKDAKSRLGYAFDYDTHPSYEKRIDAILSYPSVPTDWDDSSAFSLFGIEFVRGVFNETIWDIKQILDPGAIVFTGDKDISSQEVKSFFAVSTPMYLNLFNSFPILFDPHILNKPLHCSSSPFTRENSALLAEYYVAKQDQETLMYLNQENSPDRVFRYLDDVYDGCNVPLERHSQYFKPLESKAKIIAQECSFWLENKAIAKGYHGFLADYRSLVCVYLSLQDLVGPVKRLSEMIKTRESFQLHMTLPTTLPFVPIGSVLKEIDEMFQLEKEFEGNSETISMLKNNFISRVSDCFQPIRNNESSFEHMAKAIGVAEEQQAVTHSFINGEKIDNITFINVFFIVYNTLKEYTRKCWEEILRNLVLNNEDICS